jgi:hypothetical protein
MADGWVGAAYETGRIGYIESTSRRLHALKNIETLLR